MSVPTFGEEPLHIDHDTVQYHVVETRNSDASFPTEVPSYRVTFIPEVDVNKIIKDEQRSQE